MAMLKVRVCNHNEGGVYKIFTNAGIYYLCSKCMQSTIGYIITSADPLTQDYISNRIEDIINDEDTRLGEYITIKKGKNES